MREWNDEQVERIIGSLLRAGVLGSAILVALGGALYLMQHGSEPSDYRKFQVWRRNCAASAEFSGDV
jgi:uncharacterized membrane protein